MKKTLFFSFSFLNIFLFEGCCTGCDDEILEFRQEVIENYSTNFLIAGMTDSTGDFPEATTAQPFELLAGGIAFNREGYDFTISSEAPLSGVYLQFVYQDLNAEKVLEFPLVAQNGNSSSYRINSSFAPALDEEATLGITGICFRLAVVYSEGGVSEPKVVCFDHFGWGSDSNIGGFWELQATEETTNGITSIVTVGDSNCNTNCTETFVQSLLLDDDGSYELNKVYYEYEMGNNEAFLRFELQQSGNWATYNDQLYLFTYENRLFEENTLIEEQNFELGSGRLENLSNYLVEKELVPPRFMQLEYELNNSSNDNETGIIEFYEKPKDL